MKKDYKSPIVEVCDDIVVEYFSLLDKYIKLLNKHWSLTHGHNS